MKLSLASRPQLKWPNDVLLDGKKVTGILLESSFDSNRLSHVVLGIGLNVNQRKFPPAIYDVATSLSLFADKKFDRDELLFTILNNFSMIYESLQKRDFYRVMKEWRDRSIMPGKKISVNLAGKTIEGVCEDVTDDGALAVFTADGLTKFTAGEVTILSKETFRGGV